MAKGVLAVKGYTEFISAVNRAGPEAKKALRTELRLAGEGTRKEAQRRFEAISPRSAAGFRVRVGTSSVRQDGVSVEQRLKKTTGRNPKYGALQMTKALIPARSIMATQFLKEMDRAIDRVCDHFERG